MKKQCILFLVFSTFVTLACDEESLMPYENLQNTVDLSSPSLYYIRPLSAQVGEEVTILGEYFESTLQKYEVHFNDRYAEITHTDSYTIKVIVPENLLPGECEISLYVNGQKISSEDVFTVLDKDLN